MNTADAAVNLPDGLPDGGIERILVLFYYLILFHML